MWYIVETIIQFIQNVFLEFILFVLIDAFVKALLAKERDKEEKKKIWMLESAVLFGLCIIIYCIHHKPYLLMVFAVSTVVSTQFFEAANLVTHLQRLKDLWDENEQHSQSMEVMKEQRNRQLQVQQQQQQQQQTMMAAAPPDMNTPPPPYRGDLSLRFQPLATSSPMQQPPPLTHPYLLNKANNINSFASTPQLSHQYVRNKANNGSSYSSTPTGPPCMSPIVDSSTSRNKFAKYPQYSNTEPNLGTGRNTATKRPPSPNLSGPQIEKNHLTSRIKSITNSLRRPPLRQMRGNDEFEERATSAIKSKIMAAIGISRNDKKPAGLRNDGQNLCFMNSVIQCLARSPGLVDKLGNEEKRDMLCSMTESVFLSTVTELLQNCDERVNGHVLDPSAFCQTGSSMKPSLIAPIGHKQQQQDAAEFLMWLLSTLHSIINKNIPINEKGKVCCGQMDSLREIYGHIIDKDDIVQSLKDECHKEISTSSTLNSNSCYEAIQRLSDLEWISYKKKNQSFIDDMFSGQLIEAYRSLRATKSTVKMQTFNVLPIPIVKPRPDSGVVHLDDCFRQFSSVEQVAGASLSDNEVSNSVCANTVRQRNNMRSDSGIYSSSYSTLSPIAAGSRDMVMNDSGYDSVFRTAPVSSATVNHLRIRDTERCCLLRQMSDCLVVQLLRFYYDQRSGHASKICHPINIPLTDLNLSSVNYDSVTGREDMCSNTGNHRYSLYAMCIHIGAESTNCGHYIAYCKQSDGRWYRFDDEVVTEINMDYEITTKEVQKNAYLLFYKKSS